jgi:hypothetical protein
MLHVCVLDMMIVNEFFSFIAIDSRIGRRTFRSEPQVQSETRGFTILTRVDEFILF